VKRRNFIKTLVAGVASIPFASQLAKAKPHVISAQYGFQCIGSKTVNSRIFTVTEDAIREWHHITSPSHMSCYRTIDCHEENGGHTLIPILDLNEIENPRTLQERLVKASRKDENHLTTVYVENRPELVGLMISNKPIKLFV
jgi:hypothetical protein